MMVMIRQDTVILLFFHRTRRIAIWRDNGIFTSEAPVAILECRRGLLDDLFFCDGSFSIYGSILEGPDLERSNSDIVRQADPLQMDSQAEARHSLVLGDSFVEHL